MLGSAGTLRTILDLNLDDEAILDYLDGLFDVRVIYSNCIGKKFDFLNETNLIHLRKFIMRGKQEVLENGTITEDSGKGFE